MTSKTARTVSVEAEAAPLRFVLTAAEALLDQCSSLLESLPDAAYDADSRVLAGGTVGKHVRHVLDHYRAALDGLDSGEPLDYDRRVRGGSVETDRREALREIEALRRGLAAIESRSADEPVRIRVMLAGDGAEAVLDSSLAREIAFATHHGVHHQAMIRAIAQEHGAPVDGDFGKAPSTLHHERCG